MKYTSRVARVLAGPHKGRLQEFKHDVYDGFVFSLRKARPIEPERKDFDANEAVLLEDRYEYRCWAIFEDNHYFWGIIALPIKITEVADVNQTFRRYYAT